MAFAFDHIRLNQRFTAEIRDTLHWLPMPLRTIRNCADGVRLYATVRRPEYSNNVFVHSHQFIPLGFVPDCSLQTTATRLCPVIPDSHRRRN